jgi:ADP-ribose pyrophosphatase YjhB (NUDIX family)
MLAELLTANGVVLDTQACHSRQGCGYINRMAGQVGQLVGDRALFPVVVHVVLRRGREIFLLRRANTGFMDGYFVLPGGHQEHGESVTQAAARECLEETTVEAEDLRPLAVFPYNSRGHQGLNFVFVADRWQGEPGIGEPDKADIGGFHRFAGLPEPAAPWLGDVIQIIEAGDGFEFRELHWE